LVLAEVTVEEAAEGGILVEIGPQEDQEVNARQVEMTAGVRFKTLVRATILTM
jgi:hypothetical protein